MQLHVILTASVWTALIWRKDGISSAAEPGFLDFDNLPETNFSCERKVIGGYYADTETGCQMFHVCTIGQKGEVTDIKFLCLNGTVFDQETRVCERLDEVDCSKSESFFDLNLELYNNKAHAFGGGRGIEPENEEIPEDDTEEGEECDGEKDEGCQKIDSQEEDEEEFKDNKHKNYQQSTTLSPSVNQQSSSTTWPPQHHRQQQPIFHHHTGHGHLPSQTSFVSKHPSQSSSKSSGVTYSPTDQQTTTSVPLLATTILPPKINQPQQPQLYQSSSPKSISALATLHDAFRQSLQIHNADVGNGENTEEHVEGEDEEEEDDGSYREEYEEDATKEKNHQAGYSTTVLPGSYQYPQPTLPRPPQSHDHHFPVLQQNPNNRPQSFQTIRPQTSPTSLNQKSAATVLRFGQPFGYYNQRFHPQNLSHRYYDRSPPQQRPIPEPPRSNPFTSDLRHPQHGDYDNRNAEYSSSAVHTPSPYLLHQLKVSRVKEEQQRLQQQLKNGLNTYSTRPSPIKPEAIITSTSTTTSVKTSIDQREKQPSRHILNNHPHGPAASPFPPVVKYQTSNTTFDRTPPSSYDEYQESDVRSDPFFNDVPKISTRSKRSSLVNDTSFSFKDTYEQNNSSKRTNIIDPDIPNRNNLKKTIHNNNFKNNEISDKTSNTLGISNNRRNNFNKNDKINKVLITDGSKQSNETIKNQLQKIQKPVTQDKINDKYINSSDSNERPVLLDNLRLSPEEKQFFDEISSVMTKYIVPPLKNTGENIATRHNIDTNSTSDKLSARDELSLKLFVTLREEYNDGKKLVVRNRQKRSENPGLVLPLKENRNNNDHRYEVVEAIDEPTTILPFISYLSRIRPQHVRTDYAVRAVDANRYSATDTGPISPARSISNDNSSINRRVPNSRPKLTKVGSTTEKIDHKNGDEFDEMKIQNVPTQGITRSFRRKYNRSNTAAIVDSEFNDKLLPVTILANVTVTTTENVDATNDENFRSSVANRRTGRLRKRKQKIEMAEASTTETAPEDSTYKAELIKRATSPKDLDMTSQGANNRRSYLSRNFEETELTAEMTRESLPKDIISMVTNDRRTSLFRNLDETGLTSESLQDRSLKNITSRVINNRRTPLPRNFRVSESTSEMSHDYPHNGNSNSSKRSQRIRMTSTSTMVPFSVHSFNLKNDNLKEEITPHDRRLPIYRNMKTRIRTLPMRDSSADTNQRIRTRIRESSADTSQRIRTPFQESSADTNQRIRTPIRESSADTNQRIRTPIRESSANNEQRIRTSPIRDSSAITEQRIRTSSAQKSSPGFEESKFDSPEGPVNNLYDKNIQVGTSKPPATRTRGRSSGIKYTTTTAATVEEVTWPTYGETVNSSFTAPYSNDNFTCEGKIKGGFYADIESDCRGFFICSEPAFPNEPLTKTHFWCGQATKFNQRSRTCQADYLVECAVSSRYYSLNQDFAIPSEEKDTFEAKKL